MKSAIEYEKKYQISRQQYLDLISLLGNQRSPAIQVDRYFDTEDALLFQRGIFVRIRGDRFQIKFNLQDVLSGQSSGHTQCTESEWPLIMSAVEQESLQRTLCALHIEYPRNINTPFALFDFHGWVESVLIRKERTSYKLPNYTISLDDVCGLGTYLEIESTVESPSMTIEESRLFSYLSGHDLEYVDTGYNALYWRLHNRDIYLKSPYVMKKDKYV